MDLPESGANNWPLRGGKYSHFEGGVRANAFASGGFLPPAVRGSTQTGIMHVADWMVTYCMLAGGSAAFCASDPLAAASHLPPLDSLDLWPLLSGANSTSPRREVPLELTGASPALIVGDYKLLLGPQTLSGWEGPRYPNASSVHSDPNAQTLHCADGCLFDVANDPTEQQDLAASKPGILASMKKRLAELLPSAYSNDETGVDVPACKNKPAGMPCACFLALPGNVWNGFFGPYQE